MCKTLKNCYDLSALCLCRACCLHSKRYAKIVTFVLPKFFIIWMELA